MIENTDGDRAHGPSLRRLPGPPMRAELLSAPIIVLLCYAFVISSGNRTQADTSTLPSVLEEYRHALEKLEAKYRHLQGAGVFNESINRLPPRAPKDVTLPISKTVHYEFSKNSDSFMYLADYEKEGIPISEVFSTSKKYKFRLKKNKASNEYAISDASIIDQTKKVKAVDDSPIRKFIDAPFSMAGFPISTVIFSPSMEIDAITESAPANGDRVLKIHINNKHANDPWENGGPVRRRLYSAWVTVLPDKCWSLRQFAIVWQLNSLQLPQSVEAGSIDYGTTAGGYPVPKYSVHRAYTLPYKNVDEVDDIDELGVPDVERSFQFEDFDFKVVPEDRFALSSFGLPEVFDSGFVTTHSSVIWLFGLSLLSMAMGVTFKFLSTRAGHS